MGTIQSPRPRMLRATRRPGSFTALWTPGHPSIVASRVSGVKQKEGKRLRGCAARAGVLWEVPWIKDGSFPIMLRAEGNLRRRARTGIRFSSFREGRGRFMTARKKARPSPLGKLKNARKLIAFGWYGGKFSHQDWLLPLLPDCHHYCEPFAGSAAVLLNRPPSPVETYNDLDGEVVNFFRVLREQKGCLVEAIGLTPFSREEFGMACVIDPEASALERARRFYVRARQVRTGLAQTASLGAGRIAKERAVPA